MAVFSYDLTVTWRQPDGTTVDLPATVAYGGAEVEQGDHAGLRAEAVSAAIEHNMSDFPDDIDLDGGAVPVAVRFDGDWS